MPAAGELRCVDAAIESVLEDIDSAYILKEEHRTRSLHGFVPVTPEAEAPRCAKAASRCFSLRCDRHNVLTWEWMGASCYLRLGAALKRPAGTGWSGRVQAGWRIHGEARMTAEQRGTRRFCVEQARSRNLVHKTKRDVKPPHIYLLAASDSIEAKPLGPSTLSSSIILKGGKGDSRFLRAGAIAVTPPSLRRRAPHRSPDFQIFSVFCTAFSNVAAFNNNLLPTSPSSFVRYTHFIPCTTTSSYFATGPCASLSIFIELTFSFTSSSETPANAADRLLFPPTCWQRCQAPSLRSTERWRS
ncbi:unnamed protein product [Pleuronectes platessa]|uniref:Uncharacterized protein n=1 Tax=Pleuronectes platessa TaxID=8262 RepID=A0A9N7VNG9_PLEPL|nr:unnamed protein product [Pleuronectes platessa]